MIDLCTFTGIDKRTDLSKVSDMCAEYPGLEFGVLFSRTPEDKDSRYPQFETVEKVAVTLSGKVDIALHVCGRAVAQFVEGVDDIRALAGLFGRVQLNFSLPAAKFSMSDLDAAIASFPGRVITQHFAANAPLAAGIGASNHNVLYDASGGRGVHAHAFEKPFAGKYTGYAGGFGPETIREDIARVKAVAGDATVWIDMESRIRTDGYLDLGKCLTVATAMVYDA